MRASYESVVSNLMTTVPLAQQHLSNPGCWAYPGMNDVGWLLDAFYVAPQVTALFLHFSILCSSIHSLSAVSVIKWNEPVSHACIP